MSEPKPLTRQYRLTRAQISFATAQQYVRAFWWLLISVPTFGIICLVLSDDQALKLCGLICLLWPLTIPARAFIVTSKPSRCLLRPMTLLLGDDSLILRADENSGMKLKKSSIRSIHMRGALYVLLTRTLGIVLVPIDAFLTEEDRLTFERLGDQRLVKPRE